MRAANDRCGGFPWVIQTTINFSDLEVALPCFWAMAQAALDPALRASLLEAFTVLDRSSAGVIDVKEIGRLLNQYLGKSVDELTIGEIVAEICDTDGPQASIDFDMFCEAMAPVLNSGGEAALAERAFAAMDVDGSGHITVSELKPLMQAVSGTKLTGESVDEILKFSAGSDGKVRYADYLRATASKK